MMRSVSSFRRLNTLQGSINYHRESSENPLVSAETAPDTPPRKITREMESKKKPMVNSAFSSRSRSVNNILFSSKHTVKNAMVELQNNRSRNGGRQVSGAIS